MKVYNFGCDKDCVSESIPYVLSEFCSKFPSMIIINFVNCPLCIDFLPCSYNYLRVRYASKNLSELVQRVQ